MPFLLALILAISAARPAVTPPKIGQQAPLFTLRDQNRRPVTLTEAPGTKVVLVFYRGYW